MNDVSQFPGPRKRNSDNSFACTMIEIGYYTAYYDRLKKADPVGWQALLVEHDLVRDMENSRHYQEQLQAARQRRATRQRCS